MHLVRCLLKLFFKSDISCIILGHSLYKDILEFYRCACIFVGEYKNKNMNVLLLKYKTAVEVLGELNRSVFLNYPLFCKWLYVGITNNPMRRLKEHKVNEYFFVAEVDSVQVATEFERLAGRDGYCIGCGDRAGNGATKDTRFVYAFIMDENTEPSDKTILSQY